MYVDHSEVTWMHVIPHPLPLVPFIRPCTQTSKSLAYMWRSRGTCRRLKKKFPFPHNPRGHSRARDSPPSSPAHTSRSLASFQCPNSPSIPLIPPPPPMHTSRSLACMRTRRGTLTFFPVMQLMMKSPRRRVPSYTLTGGHEGRGAREKQIGSSPCQHMTRAMML